MNRSILLSVVIPAYNEVINYNSGVLSIAFKFLDYQKYTWEVIFVDDGSTDQTKALLSEFCHARTNTSLISIPHGGKASAVTRGILQAKGKYILFTDFDQSTPLNQFSKFLGQHELGSDVVIGVRGDGAMTKSDTLVRKIRSRIFSLLVQLVALPGILDSQCGFKSFTNDCAKKVFSRLQVSLPKNVVTGGYMGAFDVEVLYLCRKYNYKITQVPVDWIKIPSEKLNIWKEPLQMAIDTFKVRYYDLVGKYVKKS